jgi:phosphoribosyl-ATP pyrophosphohydrolase/phosphoribosyl-AMP cyclohydrolase/histidinol dehydrogenase
MLVPLIKIPTDTGDQLSANWIARIFEFGIFGRAAIGIGPDFDRETLEKIVVATGGKLDIQLLLENFDEELAIAMLNAGANQILTKEAIPTGSIPADRLAVAERLEEQTIVEGKVTNQLDLDLITENWRQGVDHIVDVRLLESKSVMAEVLISLLKSDRPDGLWPTVIVDRLGVALGLAYSSAESLRMALTDGIGVYYSRSRDELWVKGKSSGAVQQLVGVRVDCDFDTLRFQVEQAAPGFCHKETHTCFGYERNISEIVARLHERIVGGDEKSFTKKLFNDPAMLKAKLLEEAEELSEATSSTDANWEAADVLYFSLIAMMRHESKLPDVYAELARRMQRVVRRKNKLES